VGVEVAKRLGIEFCPGCVRRTRDVPQLKDVFDYDERWRLLDGLHEVEKPRVEGRRVLLFDDLFRSGATMNAITNALYDQGQARDVYALTLTRTRSKQ
jgi:predicted amidophosphoribosyltransferase